jgi:hypothetical protein
VTENKAYALVIASEALATVAVFVGFRLLGARDEAIVLATILVVVIGSFCVGLVGTHYDPDRRTRSRR